MRDGRGQQNQNQRQNGDSANGHFSSQHNAQMGVYHISVVAQMVDTHPQTLRMYERMGLVSPHRTRNNIRLYSEDDVEQVRRIQHLTQELGVNLAGVEVVFKLLREMERIRAEAESEMEAFRAQMESEFNVIPKPHKRDNNA